MTAPELKKIISYRSPLGP
jgi:hypothetical protein